MASAKLLLLTAMVAAMSASASAGLSDDIIPRIKPAFYSAVPTEEGFNLEQPNGNTREEVGMILNPGEENRDGYKPRHMMKNRKLSLGALKSAAG